MFGIGQPCACPGVPTVSGCDRTKVCQSGSPGSSGQADEAVGVPNPALATDPDPPCCGITNQHLTDVEPIELGNHTFQRLTPERQASLKQACAGLTKITDDHTRMIR